MRQGGGREKGFAFERTIARLFGVWWCDNPKAFWRNANSGARATVVGEVYSGDIIPVIDEAKPWPLSIEVKKAERWNIENILQERPREPLLLYMLQCLRAAKRGLNTTPLLVCGRNRKTPLVFLPAIIVSAAGKRIYGKHEVFRIYSPKKFEGYSIDFYCVTITAFFSLFSREDFNGTRR